VEPGGASSEGGDPARAVRVYRARNVHASPLKFEIEPQELLELWNEIEQRGYELGAIYHSHVRSEPYPSQTDVNFAANWPGVEWIIVGLVASKEPEVRSYLIEGSDVKKVPIGETAM
jgi:proteasome lid subunit RPN8/RPN11